VPSSRAAESQSHRRPPGGGRRSGASTPTHDGAFTGRTVVLTGGLTGLTREQAKEEIERRADACLQHLAEDGLPGGGDDAGSKLKRAQELGVKVLDEKAFVALLESNAP